MADSTTRAVLERHRQDIEEQIRDKTDVFEHEIAPLRRDLSDVKRAIAALGPLPAEEAVPGVRPVLLHFVTPEEAAAEKMTMKELTLKALKERFPDGATAREMLDLFANEWGRKDIMRSSYSPQLSRLQWEGKVCLDGRKWRLVQTETKMETVNR